MAAKVKKIKLDKELLRDLEELSEEELNYILKSLGFSIEDAKGNILKAEKKIEALVNLGDKKIRELLKETGSKRSRGKNKNIKDNRKHRKKPLEKGNNNEDGSDEADIAGGENEKELDIDIGNAEEEVKKLKNVIIGEDAVIDKIEIKASKPVGKLKKGDKLRVDGVEFSVDAHYVLIDHGKTKEMTIEIFDPKIDKDYQLRYFSDNLENSMEFYELQEIVYVRRPIKKVEW